jgi:hypothetical protein
MFLGFTQLDNAFAFAYLAQDSDGVPLDATSTPTYRIYSGSSSTPIVTGSFALKDSGTVTGATNATPIVITSSGHGLQTGMRVTVASVGGNTAANGTFTVTRIDADTFSLDTSVGNGSYTSGGTWHVSGLYATSFTPAAADGFAQGESYDIIVTATVDGNIVAEQYRFSIN